MAVSRWAGYAAIDDFDALEIDAQTRLIAEYETTMQIQSILSQEAQRPRTT
jgi:hypothetical protein